MGALVTFLVIALAVGFLLGVVVMTWRETRRQNRLHAEMNPQVERKCSALVMPEEKKE